MWFQVECVTLLLLLWAGVAMLGVPPILAEVLTAAAAIAVVVWRVRRHLFLVEAARTLEQTLAPDLRVAGVNHPQTRFMAVLSDLRGRERNLAGTLAQMPLYINLGAPGSGSRTLLHHAGLLWGARELRGVAGCTWWVANECIVMRPQEAQAARPGLQALRRFRSRAPINGFIVTLSMEHLATLSNTALRAQAQALRHEVDILQDLLHTRAPIYVAITHCDRLAGFLETCSGMPAALRSRLLGGNLADSDVASAAEQFVSQLDRLMTVLAQDSLTLLRHVADPIARDRVYQFPEQLGTLRAPLLSWGNAFFATSRRRVAPQVRGVYFCAVASGHHVYDRLLHAGESVRAAAPLMPPAAYFTQNIFAQGVLPDHNRPTAVDALEEPALVRHTAIAAAIALTLLPAVTYLQHAYHLSQSRDAVGEVLTTDATQQDPLANVAALDHLRQQMRALDEAAANATLLNRQSGMNQAAALSTTLRTVYLRAIRETVLQPMVAYDAQQMLLFAQRHPTDVPSDGEYVLFFNKLRTHLLLTFAYDANEHGYDARDVDWLAHTLSRRWAHALGDDNLTVQEQSMRGHVAYYLEALPLQPALHLPRDVDAIVATRRVLNRVEPTEALLLQVMDGAETYNLTLSQILGDLTAPLYSDAVIPGGLTRDGWENVVRARLSTLPEHVQTWVLGSRAVQRVTPLLSPNALEPLVAAYWARYVRQWGDFLASVHANTEHDGHTSVAEAPQGLHRLQQAVEYNMTPLRAGPGAAGSINSALAMPPEIADQAMELTTLRTVLDTLQRAPQPLAVRELHGVVERLK